jgi:superoxide reductase
MVQNKTEVYKCQLCGNMVEVLHVGGGTLVCCGQEMTQLKENDTDAAVEKHVPELTISNGKVEVVVGSVEHPMMDTHWIQFIEVITPTKVLRADLNPGDEPKATFETDEEVLKVREYCNLHGLWIK